MSLKHPIRFPRRWSRRPCSKVAVSLVAGLLLVPAVLAAPWSAGRAAAAPPLVLVWSTPHPDASPPALREAAAAYDADNSTVVMFGGIGADGTLSDATWVWDGHTWVDHPAASMTQAPPARRDASMAFDPALHQLILFGGQSSDGSVLGDTWAWNGTSWYQLPPGPSGSPGARSAASMALDPAGDLVLFGGVGTLAAAPAQPTTTTTTTTPAASPTPGSGTGSPSSGQSTASPNLSAAAPILLGDTWQWTAKGWMPSSATGPSPRWGATASYDSTTHTTVLFSGDTASPSGSPNLAAETWTWDGKRWTQQNPKASPPPRVDALAGDDPGAGGPLLVTGIGSSGPLADGWLWDGSTWIPLPSTGGSARGAAAGAFDAAGGAVLFGGIGPGGTTLAGTEMVIPTRPAAIPPTTAPNVASTTNPALPSGPTTTAPASAPPSQGPPTTTRSSGPAVTTPSHPKTGSSSRAVLSAPSFMSLETSVHNVRQGAPVRLAGSGFQPGSAITISFHSAPELVGHSVAGPNGDFTTLVSVPRSAKPGEHHFVATGLTAHGQVTTLVAAVFVLPPAGAKPTSAPVKAAMVGLALIIPGGAWLGMSGLGWWRRRLRLPTRAGANPAGGTPGGGSQPQ